jgi:hypothetical protein
MITKRMLFATLARPLLAGFKSQLDPATAPKLDLAIAPKHDLVAAGKHEPVPAPKYDPMTDIHRTGQNEYRLVWDGLKDHVSLGDAIAGKYCKQIGHDFPNVTLNYGSGEVSFQCFDNGDRLVPTYPRAAISNTINIQ